MEKLNLPVIKGMSLKPKRLSMDDYLRFVCLNLKYTLDREANRELKRESMVNVPFFIKEKTRRLK